MPKRAASHLGGAIDVRHPWFIGGALLLATVVLGVVAVSPEAVFLGGTLGPVLFAASLLVFAFGIRGSGSVTARRPLGTAALTVLAVWGLLDLALSDVFQTEMTGDGFPAAVTVFATVDPYVEFALSLVAVTQIIRAGVVPAPWNWAPAWALAALTVSWLVSALGAAATTPGSDMRVIFAVLTVDGLVRVTCAVVLGVLAIVLADRASRTAAVAVTSTSGSPL
ncbi:MAG: hypothetical protein ABWX56_10145 [Mycetocola sp.]